MKTSITQVNVATVEYSAQDTISIPYAAIMLQMDDHPSSRLIVARDMEEAQDRIREHTEGKDPSEYSTLTYGNSSYTSLLRIKVSDIMKLINGETLDYT